MLKILSQSDCAAIHRTGKRVLSEVGVVIEDPAIYKMLIEAGAVPCEQTGHSRLFFPEKMVDEYLAMCPKSFVIKNRKGEESEIKNGAPPLYYTSNGTHYTRGTSKKVVDIGESEFINFVRVADRMKNIDGLVGTSIIDYKPALRDVAGFRLMAQYSYKHLRPCIYTPAGAERIVEMAYVLSDGKPLRENMIFTLGYSIVSPLSWTGTALQLFYRTRGHGIPVMINSEPMAGGTSPVTLAGSLALADAEVLSGIVINQVIEPGRPCIYNAGFAHVMDMRTATVVTGGPENALLQSAGAEMAAFHGFPSASWALSDSAMMDSQASFEKMNTLLAHTLSGVNMVWGVGNFDFSKTICPESAVIDDEMIGACRRFASGIKVDEEQLAYDVIKDTVLSDEGGSFLETEHTLLNFREQIRHSALLNRRARTLWEENGALSIDEKAFSVVENILGEKEEMYVTGSQIEKLKRIERDFADSL